MVMARGFSPLPGFQSQSHGSPMAAWSQPASDAAVVEAAQHPSRGVEGMVGRRYEVMREGFGDFSLVFLAGGRLLVRIQGQEIEDVWRPSGLSPLTLILGGHTMPPAQVAIGPTEMCEISPPMGAPPLMGIWQRSDDSITNTLAMKLEIIVDRSGSMSPLHNATVQGLNRFLGEQRSLPHASAMTLRLVVFDHAIDTCWPEGTSLTDSSLAISPGMVQPRGQTALFDAVGSTLSSTPLAPPRVVCIVTDGQDNASRLFSASQVNALITERKNAGWTFVFLAANQDAISVGAKLGVGASTCATFSATSAGISGGFGSASASCARGAMFGSGAAAFSSAERSACLSELPG